MLVIKQVNIKKNIDKTIKNLLITGCKASRSKSHIPIMV